MKIGKRIRSRRDELGLGLRKLGVLTDLTAGFLSQIENDQTFPLCSNLPTFQQNP